MGRAAVILFFLTSCGVSFAQEGDDCHVYLLDVEASRAALEEYFKTHDEKKLKATPNLERILGAFSTEIGEERLTTRHFPIPRSKLIVTASVFYTDESF